MEYVPDKNIEIMAEIVSSMDCLESIPIFARDIMEPIIVIREIGTGNACMIVIVQIIDLLFIYCFSLFITLIALHQLLVGDCASANNLNLSFLFSDKYSF